MCVGMCEVCRRPSFAKARLGASRRVASSSARRVEFGESRLSRLRSGGWRLSASGRACAARAHQSMSALLLFLACVSLAALACGTPTCLQDGYACTSEQNQAALLALYDAMSGPTWSGIQGWGRDSLQMCSWSGVICTQSNLVISLTFANFGLVGALPDVLCELCELEFFTLAGEMLVNGSLPSCMGMPAMPNLQTLELIDCGLDGTFSDAMGEQLGASLQRLEVTCSMTGSIPTSFGALTKLVTLNLDGNYLTGTLPAELGSLTLLETLTISTNNITGTIPDTLAALTRLQILDLSDNSLVGSVPDVFGAMSELGQIDLSLNLLGGPIPPSLGMLVAPSVNLSLSFNNMTGTLDALFDGITQLVRCDLSLNSFTGSIPDSVGSKVNLTKLLLHGNLLEGTMPGSIDQLDQLLVLDLGNNSLSAFPPGFSFASLPALRALSLRHNDFTTLPPIFQMDTLNGSETTDCAWTGVLTYLDLSNLPLVDASGASLSMDALFSLIISSSSADTLVALATQQCQNRYLQTFIAQKINLHGPFLQELFAALPNIVNLDLSLNSLSGPLPYAYPFFSGTTLPWSLQMFVMANNQLSGTLPAVYLQALQGNLVILDLRNNPGLYTPNNQLPSFLAASWAVEQDDIEMGFVCPQVVERVSGASVLVSPSFYGNALCRCATNYYGTVQPDGSGCKLISSLCAGSYAGLCAEPNGTAVQVRQSFWPAPDPANANAIMVCPWTSPTQLTYCNPTGALQCQANSTTQALVCGPPSALCTAAHSGFLCSECEPGYFNMLPGCMSCLELQTRNHVKQVYLLSARSILSTTLMVLGSTCQLVLWVILSAPRASLDLATRSAMVARARVPLLRWLWESRSIFGLSAASLVLTCALSPYLSPGLLLLLLFLSVQLCLVALVYFWLFPLEPASLAGRANVNDSDPLLLLANGRAPEDEVFAAGVCGASLTRGTALRAMQANVGSIKALLMFTQLAMALSLPAVSWPTTLTEMATAMVPFTWTAPLQCYGYSVLASINASVFVFVMAALSALILVTLAVPVCWVYARLMRSGVDSLFVRIAGGFRTFPLNLLCGCLIVYSFPLLYQAGSMLSCTDGHVTRLPFISCASVELRSVRAVAGTIICSVACVALVLLGCLARLARRGALGTSSTRRQFGLLYGMYRASRWWFEYLLLTRQLVLGLFLGLLPQQNQVAVLQVSFLVLFVYLGVLVVYMPHACRAISFVDIASTMWLVLLQASLAYLQSAIGHEVSFNSQWTSYFAQYSAMIVSTTLLLIVSFLAIWLLSLSVFVPVLFRWTRPVCQLCGIVPSQHDETDESFSTTKSLARSTSSEKATERTPLLAPRASVHASLNAVVEPSEEFAREREPSAESVSSAATLAVESLEEQIAQRERERAACEADMAALKASHELVKAELEAEILRLQREIDELSQS